METKKIIKLLKDINRTLQHLNKGMDYLLSLQLRNGDSESESMTPKELKEFKVELANLRSKYIG